MENNQYKASITLSLSTAGFLVSSLFYETFMGALLTSGFGAAMVGGVADWFAVTALFRKPLGISFRTAIIPTNRDRIFRDIVDMIEHKLLNKAAIKHKITEYDISHKALDYIEKQRGKKHIIYVLQQIMQDFILKSKPHDMEKAVDRLIKANAGQLNVSYVIIQGVEWSIANGYAKRLIDFAIDELLRLVKQEQMTNILTKLFTAALKSYEADMKRRKFVTWILTQSGVTELQFATLAQKELIEFLQEVKDSSHPLRLSWDQMINDLIKTGQLQKTIESWDREIIQRYFDVNRLITRLLLRVFPEEGAVTKQVPKGWEQLNGHIDTLVEHFKSDSGLQKQADDIVKKVLIDFVEGYHYQIYELVKNNLNQFTNDKLVCFIEEKVGNDLQLIRINGSIVGGIVGILLFLLTYWI